MTHEAVGSGSDAAPAVAREAVVFDAIVLAGGRSSRLGGESKAALRLGDDSLLDLAVRAVPAARRVAVVGDAASLAAAERLSDRIVVTREQPEFAGPAAGIGAGSTLLDAMSTEPSDYTIVLACDMPRAAGAVQALLDAVPEQTGDGAIAIDGTDRLQYLTAVYSTAALTAALADRDLMGESVRSLVAGLRLTPVAVTEGATSDVDTWEDAARLGIVRPDDLTPPATATATTAAAAATKETT